jgi:hypothetical protein
MVATFVDKTLAFLMTLSGTVVRSVIGNGCLEMRMSTTSRGSGNNYLKGTPTFDFAHIVEPATPAALSPYHRTISSYSYGYVGGVDTSIHINRPSPPTTIVLFKRVTVAANRTMHHTVVPPAGAHIDRYSVLLNVKGTRAPCSGRGCSNYVRT